MKSFSPHFSPSAAFSVPSFSCDFVRVPDVGIYFYRLGAFKLSRVRKKLACIHFLLIFVPFFQLWPDNLSIMGSLRPPVLILSPLCPNSDSYIVRVKAVVMTRDDSTGGWLAQDGGALTRVGVCRLLPPELAPVPASSLSQFLIRGERLQDKQVKHRKLLV